MGVLGALASRRAARTSRCSDDGARLHALAWDVRSVEALLHKISPRGHQSGCFEKSGAWQEISEDCRRDPDKGRTCLDEGTESERGRGASEGYEEQIQPVEPGRRSPSAGLILGRR